jgi:predicted nucleotidyltransferase
MPMPLSKHYVDTQIHPQTFDPQTLGRELEAALPEAVFAVLLGSARDGTVAAHSDLDIAVYMRNKPSLETWAHVEEVVRRHLPDTRTDLGFLNQAEPVYRFEALKGRLLFARDLETWVRFFSVTCREYEHQMLDYERQRQYRLTREKSCN